MNQLKETILQHADSAQVESLSRFFKTGKGQYGEGDLFLGIKVPVTRSVVKELWQTTTFADLEECISSPYHEMRLAALLTLVQMFKHAKKEPVLQQRCVDFYLTHTAYINNWDLVDLSCYEILGSWLMDKDRTLLYTLAREGKILWEQRIGIVTTMAFCRAGQLDDTYAIADIFLQKPQPLHDLLQKAVGWLLREAGKYDKQRLKNWLSPRCATMPRTTLRYAIEHLTEEERIGYMKNTNIHFCQSCGMPLTDEVRGTNADGSKSEDYCIFCYKDGAFTGNFTMEQMAEYCAMFVDKYNQSTGKHLTACEYKKVLLTYYPTLKRWREDDQNLPHANHPMKQIFIDEVNALGIPELHIDNLYVLVGSFINQSYTIEGNQVKLLDDNASYWGTQVQKKDGRCYGIACSDHYILVSEYAADGADAQLVVLKKR